MDKTGPQGMGPGTGRGCGPCVPGFLGGRGLGMRHGWGWCGCWPWSKKDRSEWLKDYQAGLREELKAVEEELNEK